MPLITRRELTLILLALSIFLVAYNYEASVYTLSSTTLFKGANSTFSADELLTVQDALREDGRRNIKYTDELEKEILGDWEIDTRQQHDLGPYGLPEDGQFRDWSNGDVPQTELIGHVPGYTILENVLLANGVLYLVHNLGVQVFPKTEMMLSTGINVPGSNLPPVSQELKYLTRSQALDVVGFGAHRIANTTIICFDHPQSITNESFFALYRAYQTLIHPLPSSASKTLPPSQILLPNLPRSLLSQTAYYTSYQLSRISFPFLNHLFSEDFTDLEKTDRPLIFDRILLADRIAAETGAQSFDFSTDVKAPFLDKGEETDEKSKAEKNKKESEIREATAIEAIDKRLPFAPAFALPAPHNWVSDLRTGALTLPVPQPLTYIAKKSNKPRKVVTYVSTQGRKISAPHLRETDHENLLRQLRKAGEANGFDVYLVDLGAATIEGAVATWRNLASAAVRSTVMLGVHGDPLAYAPLLQPGSGSTIIEFFPDGKFVNDHEFMTRSLGIEYVAWRNTKKYTRGNLPPISPPTRADNKMLTIDVNSVVNFVKEQMRR